MHSDLVDFDTDFSPCAGEMIDTDLNLFAKQWRGAAIFFNLMDQQIYSMDVHLDGLLGKAG